MACVAGFDTFLMFGCCTPYQVSCMVCVAMAYVEDSVNVRVRECEIPLTSGLKELHPIGVESVMSSQCQVMWCVSDQGCDLSPTPSSGPPPRFDPP